MTTFTPLCRSFFQHHPGYLCAIFLTYTQTNTTGIKWWTKWKIPNLLTSNSHKLHRFSQSLVNWKLYTNMIWRETWSRWSSTRQLIRYKKRKKTIWLFVVFFNFLPNLIPICNLFILLSKSYQVLTNDAKTMIFEYLTNWMLTSWQPSVTICT